MLDELLVSFGGLLLIAGILRYFLFAERRAGRAVADDRGVQEVSITVQGGYDPPVLRVRAGQPVRLVFDRRETNPCSEEVVLSDFGIRRYLPAHQSTAIELPPSPPGEHDFYCGMGMLHGKLVITREDGENPGKGEG